MRSGYSTWLQMRFAVVRMGEEEVGMGLVGLVFTELNYRRLRSAKSPQVVREKLSVLYEKRIVGVYVSPMLT